MHCNKLLRVLRRLWFTEFLMIKTDLYLLQLLLFLSKVKLSFLILMVTTITCHICQMPNFNESKYKSLLCVQNLIFCCFFFFL